MVEMGDCPRDLASLVVSQNGSLEATGDPFEPYRLEDAEGVVVAPAAAYLRDLQACGRSATTQRTSAFRSWQLSGAWARLARWVRDG